MMQAKSIAINWTKLLNFVVGMLFLAFGIMFYAEIRPCLNDYFRILLPNEVSLWDRVGETVCGGLPTLFHTASLSLISMSLVRESRWNRLLYSGLWVVLNLVFELGQLAKPTLEKLRTGILYSDIVIGEIADYFAQGTFDIGDIVGAFAGGAIAFCIASLAIHKKEAIVA